MMEILILTAAGIYIAYELSKKQKLDIDYEIIKLDVTKVSSPKIILKITNNSNSSVKIDNGYIYIYFYHRGKKYLLATNKNKIKKELQAKETIILETDLSINIQNSITYFANIKSIDTFDVSFDFESNFKQQSIKKTYLIKSK
jgi:hypothetical protein